MERIKRGIRVYGTHNRVRSIMSTGIQSFSHGEILYCLFRRYHRVLEIDIPQHCLTYPRPDGPLDFPPPEGGVVEDPLVTRHLDVVVRNHKMRSKGREE